MGAAIGHALFRQFKERQEQTLSPLCTGVLCWTVPSLAYPFFGGVLVARLAAESRSKGGGPLSWAAWALTRTLWLIVLLCLVLRAVFEPEVVRGAGLVHGALGFVMGMASVCLESYLSRRRTRTG